MRERLQHLPYALSVSGVVLVAGVLIGLVAGGGVAALGAGLGVLLVVASYVVSTLGIAWADSVAPRLVFPVGIALYVTKFSLFGAMLIAIEAADWAGTIPMALGIIAAVVGWTGFQIWWTVRLSRPRRS